MLTRRTLMLTGFAFAGSALALSQAQAEALPDAVANALRSAEEQLGARTGLAVLRTDGTPLWMHHANEAFAFNSTFKAFAAAAVLSRVDAGQDSLDRLIRFSPDEIVTYSPVTEARLDSGMTLGEICEAALTTSDNTAGNLMLDAVGGPEGFTAFMRQSGDTVSRLDRWETDLNEAAPGDPRDTTSPEAAAESLRRFLFGNLLSEPSRALLRQWLEGNQVGGPLFRAALPDGWQIADRTGAGGYGSRSIIAAIWSPGGAPVVAALYLTQTDASMEERNTAVAAIGAAIFSSL